MNDLTSPFIAEVDAPRPEAIGHLAHHANPHRRAVACEPLAQLEEIRHMCRGVGHHGHGVAVEAVAEVLTELRLLRYLHEHNGDPVLRMRCSICGQRARYGDRWHAGANAHTACLAAMPSDEELSSEMDPSSDEWRR